MSRYKKLIILLLVVLLLILSIVAIQSMKIKNVEVVGGEHYSAEEICDMMFDGFGEKYTGILWFKDKVIGMEKPSIPFVEKVEYEIIDKNSVRFYVYDKTITGCVEHMGKYMYFDREGIVVETSDERLESVPVITGVEFSKVVLNEQLELKNILYFSKVMDIALLLEKYGLKASEVNFDIRNNVTVYINGSIALIGDMDNLDYKMSGLKNVLAAAGNTKYKFDFRHYSPDRTDVSGIPINN